MTHARARLPKTLQVQLPRDLRPIQERQSAGATVGLMVPGALIYVFKLHGSEVSGAQHFVVGAWKQLHQSIVGYLGSSGLFARVGGNLAGADYVLETDVLHLLAHQYHTSREVLSIGGYFSAHRRFLPSATVTLRLRLRTRDGRVIGTRVVSGAFLGGPQYGRATLGHVARRALINALFAARRLVASWALADQHRGLALAEIKARYDKQPRFTFLVHRMLDARAGAELYEVEYPSGRVVRRHLMRGAPVVGEPGQWLLSPFNLDGVFLPAVVYAALSAKVAERFVLRRFEQLDVYRYLGRRAASAGGHGPQATGHR